MAQPDGGGDLTLHEVAERLGVHYNTVYRYVRRGRLEARRVGGEWRVDPEALERFGDDQPKPGRRGAQSWELHQRRLLDRLVDGDVEGSWEVVTGALDSGAEPTDLHLRLLGPTMAEIGERWAAGELDVADEHRASAVTNLLLGRLSTHTRRRGRRRGRVILGAAPGDHHSLPVAMMADVLRGHGYVAIDLGADVPPPSFERSVRGADQLLAVTLYAGAADNDLRIAETVRAIRRGAESDVQIIVGGRGFTDAEHAISLGADSFAETGGAVVELVQAAADGRRARAAS
ncbi:MAG: B12-binding domain-containing protein [Actinomycetota bacterium]